MFGMNSKYLKIILQRKQKTWLEQVETLFMRKSPQAFTLFFEANDYHDYHGCFL